MRAAADGVVVYSPVVTVTDAPPTDFVYSTPVINSVIPTLGSSDPYSYTVDFTDPDVTSDLANSPGASLGIYLYVKTENDPRGLFFKDGADPSGPIGGLDLTNVTGDEYTEQFEIPVADGQSASVQLEYTGPEGDDGGSPLSGTGNVTGGIHAGDLPPQLSLTAGTNSSGQSTLSVGSGVPSGVTGILVFEQNNGQVFMPLDPSTDQTYDWEPSSSTIVVSPLPAGAQYFVVATGGPQDTFFSPYSNFVSVAATVPATPTNLTATASNKGSIWLVWNNTPDDETGFNIYRSLTNSFSTATKIGSTGADECGYSDTTVPDGQTYYYWVTAAIGSGQSTSSNVASAAIPYVSVATTQSGTLGNDAPTIFTISRTGDDSDALRVSYTLGGTAVQGPRTVPSDLISPGANGDYAGALGEITIPAGARSVQLVLTPLYGSTDGGNGTIVIAVSTPAGSGGATQTATATQVGLNITGDMFQKALNDKIMGYKAAEKNAIAFASAGQTWLKNELTKLTGWASTIVLLTGQQNNVIAANNAPLARHFARQILAVKSAVVMEELGVIHFEAIQWNESPTQPPWSYSWFGLANGYECAQQAEALMTYLELPSFHWYFWTFQFVGVQNVDPTARLYNGAGVLHHHIVAVAPVGESEGEFLAGLPPANPLPPMILDSFHAAYTQKPWGVTLESFGQLAADYPYWEPDQKYKLLGYGTTPPAGGPI